MLQKLALLAVGIIVLLLILYAGVTVPLKVSTNGSEINSEQLPYAMRGAYPVGLRHAVIETNAALPITVWYPAINQDNQRENITYAYPIKLGDSFMVKFATYSGQAINDAPYDMSANPYPLVILSPGFSMGASAYGWLAEHLASHGFVVIAPEHQEHFDGELNGLWQSLITRPQDMLTVLDYVDEQVQAGAGFEGFIDAERVAVIGHSYGGYTTLAAVGAQMDTTALREHCQTAYESNHPAAWLCDEIVPHLEGMAALAGLDSVPEGLWRLPTDSRIDAAIALAGDAFMFGQTGLAEITVPVLAIGGTIDHDSPFDWGTQPTYDFVSSARKVIVGLDGAEHMIFTGSCEAIPVLLRFMSDEFCSDGYWNRYHAHNLTKHFATAFLLAELQQNADAASVLMPENAMFEGIIYEAQGY